jgi:MazG family protein
VEDKQSDALERVMDLVRYLRTHCPWDAAQTPRSLIPYLLEEAHETADAISRDADDDLRSELGDLLLNVAFQLVLGEERAAFSASEVADTVIGKMQRRHPHLYGLGEKEEWETLKAREREASPGSGDGPVSLLHEVAPGLDPLSRAHRIQDRVSAVGFDWDDAMGAFAKVAEELEEVREQLEATAHHAADAGAALEEELGYLLFAVVNLSRLAGAHALTALHGANAKFTRRFQALERLAVERDLSLEQASLEELEELWSRVKAGEVT